MNDNKSDLEQLEQKIKAEQEKYAPKVKNDTLNAGIEFTGPLIGGIVLGYFIDQYFDTAPIFIITLLLLGVGAGIMNIYKLSQNIGGTIGYSELHSHQKKAKNLPSDDSSDQESAPKK